MCIEMFVIYADENSRPALTKFVLELIHLLIATKSGTIQSCDMSWIILQGNQQMNSSHKYNTTSSIIAGPL